MSSSEYEGGSQRFSGSTGPDNKGVVALRALNLAERKLESIAEAEKNGKEVVPFDYHLSTWYLDYAKNDIGHVENPRERKDFRTRLRRTMVKAAREMPRFRKALIAEKNTR